ncbi:MAG: NUDIX domain-containing protein [Oscillospiraceae bacterium]|nr:NUDIX domain-containing protein [Oscillospiraceae bacterium]
MEGKLRNMTAIYITYQGKMLMLYRVGSRVVAPSWCGIGGHFEKDELNDAKSAIFREMKEEIGLSEKDLENLKMRYITLRNKNGEIRQNYYFFADLKEGAEIKTDCDEGTLEWVGLDEVSEREMPFTAKGVLEHYLKTGRFTDVIYGGLTTGKGVVFAEMDEF